MTTGRLTPFDLVFGEMANERFPAIRDGFDPPESVVTDRDSFLMNREAVSLIHELRPDEGLGQGVDQLAALVHHAYLFWKHGSWVFRADRNTMVETLGTEPAGTVEPRPQAYYLQMPHGLLWGQLGESEPHAPLDGCFVAWGPRGEPRLQVLGIFGFHPDRAGFGVVEADGPGGGTPRQSPGPPAFAPAMDGGKQAGLYSVNHADELLLLASITAERVTARCTEAPDDGPHDVEIR